MPKPLATNTPAPGRVALRRTMLGLFFLTGACGLVYEVAWARLLRLVMGNTTYSVTTVLCAFMGGMALGSYLAGRLAHRRNDPLRLFALLQAAVAVSCFFLPALIDALEPLYRTLYLATGGAGLIFRLLQFLFSALLLLVPATLMGATLPVLARFFVAPGQPAGRPLGVLYAVNTFGAAAGAFATGFFLLPALGLSATNRLACLMSLLAALAAWLLHRRTGPLAAPAPAPASASAKTPARNIHAAVPPSPRAMRWLLPGYALAGAAALIYEVAWTRVLALLIGSSVYAFSLMLTAFILGLAAGSFLFARLADRIRNGLRALAVIELLIAASALAPLPFIDRLPVHIALWLAGQGGGFWHFQAVQFLLALLVMLVPTLLMGAAFPLANRLLAAHTGDPSRAVGAVGAANTLGGIAGAFAGGFVFIPALGLQGCLFVAIALNAAVGGTFALLGASGLRTRLTVAAAWAALAAFAFLAPAWDPASMSFAPYQRARGVDLSASPTAQALLQSAHAETVLFHKEGLAATVTVSRAGDELTLKVNGKSDASTNPGDMHTQKLLAHIPLLLHPAPDPRVLVIGLASGITLGTAGLYPVKSLDCAEIAPEMIDACRFFDAFNHGVLDDPRTRILLADGRNHLALTDQRYDVIVSEPSNPWIAGVADLFTAEFFALCRDRLNRGGIACIWLEGYNIDEPAFGAVLRTFQSVFPDAMLWSPHAQDYLLIGFRDRPAVDAAGMAARMSKPAVAADLAPLGIRTPADLLAYCLMSAGPLKSFAGAGPLHTDDNALLEFSTPRSLIAHPGDKVFYERVARAHGVDLSFLAGADPEALAAFAEKARRATGARACAMVGHALLLQKRLDEAYVELAQAARLNAADPVLAGILDEQADRASAALQQRRFDEARSACRRILDIHDKHPRAHFILGRLALLDSDNDLAARHLFQAADLAPDEVLFNQAAAALAGQIGRHARSAGYYRRLCDLRPGSPEAACDLAWALVSDPKTAAANAPEAIHQAKRACLLTANADPRPFDALGVAHAAAGNFPEALAAAGQALSLARSLNRTRLIAPYEKRIALYTANLPAATRPSP